MAARCHINRSLTELVVCRCDGTIWQRRTPTLAKSLNDRQDYNVSINLWLVRLDWVRFGYVAALFNKTNAGSRDQIVRHYVKVLLVQAVQTE